MSLGLNRIMVVSAAGRFGGDGLTFRRWTSGRRDGSAVVSAIWPSLVTSAYLFNLINIMKILMCSCYILNWTFGSAVVRYMFSFNVCFGGAVVTYDYYRLDVSAVPLSDILLI